MIPENIVLLLHHLQAIDVLTIIRNVAMLVILFKFFKPFSFLNE